MVDSKNLLVQQYNDMVLTQHSTQILGGSAERHSSSLEGPIASYLNDIWVELHLPDKAPPPPPPPPPPVLDKLELDSGYIAFSDGVPVGGFSHLSLFPNGSFSFTGHFRVSGAPSYDVSLVWVLKSASGTVFQFAKQGRVHGTFEAGSRDFDWGDSGTNPALAAAWGDISVGYEWQWKSGVNIDVGALADSAQKAIGVIGSIIAII